MNITFLIGNGFDVNLGIKSRYIDFYKDYVKSVSVDDRACIQRFKKEINDFIKSNCRKSEDSAIDWRDLEVALGAWTERLQKDEAEPLYIDIIDGLRDYLIKEYSYFDAEAFTKDDLLNYLLDPINRNFSRTQIETLRNFWDTFSGQDEINIISFNYTDTIEQLLGFKGERILLGYNFAGRKTYLNSVKHIHQTLADEEILLGLNDMSQIANADFHKDRHICNLLIKPMTNTLLGTGIDQDCETIISNTHLFVLFGTSAGITDRKWWKSVCNRLHADNVRLLYFIYCPDDVKHVRIKYDVMSESAFSAFLKSAAVKEDTVFESLFSKSFLCFKSDLFKLQPNYRGRIPSLKTLRINNSDVTIRVQDMAFRYISLFVDAPDEKTGVAAERKWIAEFFPGFKEEMQSLNHYKVGDKHVPFDQISFSYKGIKKDIYFDISSFFGKDDNYKIAAIPMNSKVAAFSNTIKKLY